MSFVATQGYPDWLRVSTAVSEPLSYAETPTATTGLTYGPFFVGYFPTTRLLILQPSTPFKMIATIKWYLTQTMVQFIGGMTWRCDGTLSVVDAVSNIGPWLQLTIHNPTAVPATLGAVSMVATMMDPSNARQQRDRVMLGLPQASIGGSSTSVIPAVSVTTGPAVLTVASNAASWQARLTATGPTTKLYTIGEMDNLTATNTKSVTVNLPSWECKLTIHNMTVGAKTFAASLVLP